MTRLLPLILVLLLAACAGPRAAAPLVPPEPVTQGAEPADPSIKPMTAEEEEYAK